MAYRQAIGRQGEELAAAYLESRGMRVIERNFRVQGGEIDLIAEDGRYLAFVEVKTCLLYTSRGEDFPHAQPPYRQHRSGSPRPCPQGEALLPARPFRQSCQGPRTGLPLKSNKSA